MPEVYNKIRDFEWDLTIFAQYYLTILIYNTPKEYSKIILDLFFLDGENILHSLIVRMMKLQEGKILGFKDELEMINYFKRDLILDSFKTVEVNKAKAKDLSDFELNFLKTNLL